MIKIDHLQKVIAQQTVLDIPTFILREGEIAGLVGPVGSGKEVFLNILLGKVRPTLGTVTIGDLNPYHERDALSKIMGVMFLEDSLYQRQTVLANLNFYCQLYGLPTSRISEVLQLVGLGDQSTVMADKLLSGLARRLAFGRAILHHPKVLLLVEPFARCDEISMQLLSRLMRQQAIEGVTILILADDQARLEMLCDTLYRIEKGRISEGITSHEGQNGNLPFKIPVRQEGKVVLVNPTEILYADAAEGKAILLTIDGRLATQFTLSELEGRLERSGFFRAHRSYLVNLQHVREVIPFTRNSYSLRLDDPAGTLIPLSRQAAADLKDLLGF